MNPEAKAIAIRWRRILFGFHLLLVLLARLAVGSIDTMPPPEIYNGFALWGFMVVGHALLLAILDGRDHAELPFEWMKWVIDPRERRWSLFVIDALLYVMFTIAIANRVIPEQTIFQYVVPLSLLWLAHTGIGFLHILLVLYAEVRDRTQGKDKRKNDAETQIPTRLVQGDDGELIDWIDVPEQEIKRSGVNDVR